MKLLYLVLLLTVINLSSSQRFIRRRPRGTEPYIPYHHVCTRSCWDSPQGSIDLRIKWSCCDRGWDRCCASSIIQIPNIESLPNPYESIHFFDRSIQSNQNPLYPTHSDYSNSASQLDVNPFYKSPVFQQNAQNSHLSHFTSQQSDNLQVNQNFKRRIIGSPDNDGKNETTSKIEVNSSNNSTSPELYMVNANTSAIELAKSPIITPIQ